ncbi:MAG: hypothetical protein EPN88_05475 [Bacteroidetes bacterium]|nr:MAG: hypothetical protein EPN88_05475 [Bacteroidota bacterium]
MIPKPRDNSQSFNDYPYCLNNPLKYSDPSGMLFAAADFGRDIDAYQSWMCDVAGSYHYSGGGGGGGADPNYAASYIYNSNVKFYGYYDYSKTGAYISKYDGHIESYGEYYANKIAPDLAEFQSEYIYQKFKEAAAVKVSYHMASLIGGVVFAIPTSDEGLFNRLATINYLLSNATSRYIKGINGWCSRNVFDVLEFGNLCGQRPGYAYLAGSFLMRLGFMTINDLTGYNPSLSDITVFDRNSVHTAGHIQIWCGSEWVSDFRQGYCGFYPCFIQGGLGFSPYSTETTPTFTIYRRPWWLPSQN